MTVMATLQRPGAELHYTVTDLTPPWIETPETIVLHHGLGATSGTWAEWLPLLASRYRLVTYDMRGCGRSSVPGPEQEWSHELLIEDLMAIATAAGAEKFHFVGESLGGIIGYHLAIDHPERIRSIVSVNASHQGGSIRGGVGDWKGVIDGGGMKAWSAGMMPGRFHTERIDPEKLAWYQRTQDQSREDVVLAVSGLIRSIDLRPALSRVTTPILLLSAEASPFVPLDVLLDVREAIGAAASMHVIAGARHGVVFSHPRECVDAYLRFLAERVPA